MNYWMVKSEPGSYAWTDFLQEGKTSWTGVRNFQARNNLRAMKLGDEVLFYHSGEEKQVVGLAKVSGVAKADPTAKEGDWVCVELAPLKALARPVTLPMIKEDKALAGIGLVRNSRLSVLPLRREEFARLLKMAERKLGPP